MNLKNIKIVFYTTATTKIKKNEAVPFIYYFY